MTKLSPLGMAVSARGISKKAHDGQLYGSRDYFQYHVHGVVKNVRRLVPRDQPLFYHAIATAWLHDVVEDTWVTLEYLTEAGMPPRVVHSVDCITKRKYESYSEYLERVHRDDAATLVKRADIAFNMSESIIEGHARRITKYATAARAISLGSA